MASSSSPSSLSSSKPGSGGGGGGGDANRGKAPPQQHQWEWKSVSNPQDELGFGGAKARSWEEMEEAANSGLKLGKRTYQEQKGSSSPGAVASSIAGTGSSTATTATVAAGGGGGAAATTTSGPGKKGRGCSQASVLPKCQVEGCQADLSGSKDYHRRHKVCEVHSKTPKNTVNGQEQRFCQQCSRFHLLPEFDEGKRSCRRRLQGHNERRRKPQPDALAAYNMRDNSFQAAYQRLGVGSSIVVDSHGDHSLGYGSGSWGRLGRDQFLSKQLVENLSPEKLLLLLQNSKRPTGLPTIPSSASTTAAAAAAAAAAVAAASNSSCSIAKPDQMKLSLSPSAGSGGGSGSGSGGGGGGGGGLCPVADSGRALSLLSSSDVWTKSPASYELVSSGPAGTTPGYILAAAAAAAAGGGSIASSDAGSPSPTKAQEAAAAAMHHHHHHHRHHHQSFQQSPEAIPMTSSSDSSTKKQQQQQQRQQQPQLQNFSSHNRF